MLLARALIAKLRPQRLSPRELQEQLDVSRIAALTMLYKGSKAGHDVKCNKLEQEVQALSPEARKKRVQLALNDQVCISSMR